MDEFKCCSNVLQGFTRWEMSQAGVLRVKTTGKQIFGSMDSNGYAIVTLYQDHKTIAISFHRLYARLWMPNPLGLTDIDHIDGDRMNNSPNNLRWCSRRENCRNRRSGRSSTGIQNVTRTSVHNKYLYWRISFMTDSGSYNELFARSPDDESPPKHIIDRRNELCLQFHGDFGIIHR